MAAIRTVGVIGCGLMGSGIAEACIRAGYPTVVRETTDELVALGRQRIERNLAQAVERNRLTGEDRTTALALLSFTVALDDFHDCDLVIEAATENPDLKKQLFAELDRLCLPTAVLASNTSSIPIVDLGAATTRPERVVGLHFFNPVSVMKLVEVVSAITTSDETVETARAFAESLGKRAILAKDRAGFIVNALLVPYLLDAIRLVEQGIASKEDVDEGMKLGCGHPMGPIALADFIGLDTICFIAEVLYDELHEPRYAPPTILKQMVTAGLHGKKSGRGFYNYPG